MTAVSRALGACVVAATLAGIVWASQAPLTIHKSSDGLLRLAWSARPERIEQCRRPAESEQANLPRHMRQELICEGSTATYRLEVRRGGSLIAEQVVRGGGLRHDRPVYVFKELPVAPVDTHISVRFDRLEPEHPDRSSSSRTSRHREAVPPHLSLEHRLRVAPRQVVLVTYDPGSRALKVVTR